LLDLSEEYLHSMINETRPFDWDGGTPSEKLYNASYYALPPEQSWPYISDPNALLNLESTIIPLMPTSGYGELFSTDIALVDRDLVNYSQLTYPPTTVHAQAIYGPVPNGLASVQNTGDPTPFENLIAQHHSVAFMTAVGAWSQNPQTGIFEYNPNGDQTIDHAMLLVGYDRDKQIFRIKNSWGPGWNGNGYGDFSYEFFLKTATGALYITGIRNPQQATGGNAVWRGFWRGSLGGVNGVTVVYHTYQPTGNTSVVDDAAAFFGDDGSSLTFPNVLTATLNTVTFSGRGEVTLQQGTAGTATATESPSGATTTWYRCGATPGQYNINPSIDIATVQDPYVLPPCNDTALPCCTSPNQSNCILLDRVINAVSGSCLPGFSVIGGGVTCNAAVSPSPYCTSFCTQHVACVRQPSCVPGKPCPIK
jgi:Papain family cysteine protease